MNSKTKYYYSIPYNTGTKESIQWKSQEWLLYTENTLYLVQTTKHLKWVE